MSAVKKIILLLLTLVGLFIFSVFSFDYESVLGDNYTNNTQKSTFEKYVSKASEIKEQILTKINLYANDGVLEKQPIDLQLIKKDGVVLLNGVFKDEQQAKEVADLLAVNRTGVYKYQENRVKDVMLLNKLSSIMTAYKDFFDDGSKLSIENGQVLLNGQLKSSSYGPLFDSILAKSKLEIISNIKEPTIAQEQEIVENEKIQENASLIDNEQTVQSQEVNDVESANRQLEVKKEINQTQVSQNNQEVSPKDSVTENEVKEEQEVVSIENESKLSQNSQQLQTQINSILSNNKINFKRRSTTITKESYDSVKKIAKILKENSNVKVEIAGHTDSRGRASLNKRISQDRANSVKTALVALGVSKANLTAVGYGEDFPIAKDDKDGLSEINRRVEFNIIGE